MFAEEKPRAAALAARTLSLSTSTANARVHLDGCVEVEAAYYSAPPGWIGRASRCSGTACMFGCSIREPDSCCANTCASSAAVIASTTRTAAQRTPARHAQLLARAGKAGTHIGRSAEQPVRPARANPRCAASRACCRFAKKYGVARSTMPARPRSNWKSVRLPFRAPLPGTAAAAPLTLRQVDPLIRQLTLYRDLIEERTKENNQETNHEPH